MNIRTSLFLLSVSLTLAFAADPLVITSSSSLPLATVGLKYTYQLEATGGTGILHWSVIFPDLGNLPPNISLDETGLIQGVPASAGTFQVSFKVTDDAGRSDQRTFHLTVSADPVAVDDTYAVVPGQALQVPSPMPFVNYPATGSGLPGVLANDAVPIGTRLILDSLPSHGTMNFPQHGKPDGTFDYTPAAGFTGQDSFRYRLEANGHTSTATVTIIVPGSSEPATCVMTPPVALFSEDDDQIATGTGVSYDVQVLFRGVPLTAAPMQVSLFDGFAINRWITDDHGNAFPFALIHQYQLSPGVYANTAVSDYPAGQAGPPFRCNSALSLQDTLLLQFVDLCPALFALGHKPTAFIQPPETHHANPGGLALFRRFRDRVLKANARGAEYANLYYRFRPELWKIFLTSPSLLWRAREVLERNGPLVQALLRSEKTSITSADGRAVDDLLRSIQERSGSELRQALAGIRDDISNRKLLASFGISLREGSTGAAPGGLRRAFGKLPLHFESAEGPVGSAPQYLACGPGYTIQLKPSEAVLSLRGGSSPIRMKLVGGARAPHVVPESPLAGSSNYLVGRDPKNWRTGVTQYARVRYEKVYRNIDLAYYGNQQELEYDLIVSPGASPPERIAVAFSGVGKLSTNSAGDLKLAPDVYLRRPVAYQEIDGVRRHVSAEYVLESPNRVGFRLGSYDKSRALVIDPVLSYASLFGGSGFEFGAGIAVDAEGNAYVTGATTSADLQTLNPTQSKYRNGGRFHADAFVTKFDPTGSKILYSTYFGGSDDDVGAGIAVDPQGNAYITGATSSADFPAVQPIQASFGGAGSYFKTDAFLMKLDPTGSKILYSTYLGGNGDDGARGIALDPAGNVYIAGITSSTNFPIKNALQTVNRGGKRFLSDGFVTKVNAAGNALVYSTYLGGTGDEAVGSIAVDRAGNVYVAGFTYSNDFPVVHPIQKTYGGSADAFAAKIDPSGSTLVYSTYLGGTSDDFGTAIAIDPQGSAYITGFTGSSADFPIVKPAQPKFGSGDELGLDGFVAKLNPAGSALVYSTFLGGKGRDYPYTIGVDAQGAAYVAGETESLDFASDGALQSKTGGKLDAFLAKLKSDGSAFEYRTFIGGADDDGATALALDASGNVYLTGGAVSLDAPATFGAFQTDLHGPMDSFVIKIGAGAAPPAFVSVSAASFSGALGLAPQSIASGFGTGLATQVTPASTSTLPTVLDGVSVSMKDSSGTERLAPLFLVAPGQINFLVPDGTQPGLAAITVTRDNQSIAAGVAHIFPIAPTLFSADASGSGIAAGLALHVAADGTRTGQLLTGGPVDLGPDTDQVYLLLFGTGIRNLTTPATATIGGVTVPVLAAVAQGQFEGLDQVNIGPLPRTLMGKGSLTIQLTVDGVLANPVTVAIE